MRPPSAAGAAGPRDQGQDQRHDHRQVPALRVLLVDGLRRRAGHVVCPGTAPAPRGARRSGGLLPEPLSTRVDDRDAVCPTGRPGPTRPGASGPRPTTWSRSSVVTTCVGSAMPAGRTRQAAGGRDRLRVSRNWSAWSRPRLIQPTPDAGPRARSWWPPRRRPGGGRRGRRCGATPCPTRWSPVRRRGHARPEDPAAEEDQGGQEHDEREGRGDHDADGAREPRPRVLGEDGQQQRQQVQDHGGGARQHRLGGTPQAAAMATYRDSSRRSSSRGSARSAAARSRCRRRRRAPRGCRSSTRPRRCPGPPSAGRGRDRGEPVPRRRRPAGSPRAPGCGR